MKVQKLQLHHIAGFEDVKLEFPQGVNPNRADVHLLVGANGSGKSSILLTLAQFYTSEMNGASERLETTLSRITSQETRFTFNDDSFVVGVEVDSTSMPLDVLPDGLKSILSWLGDLLMRLDRIPWQDDVPLLDRPILLLLDEAEVHLHPAWQRRLLTVVQDLFPKAQILVSTHSPFVVASASDAWIHCLRVEGNHVTADPPLRSKVGASYASILREVLGVPEEFSVEVEELFATFYALKSRAVTGDSAALSQMGTLATRLASYGLETESIVAQEIRQVRRLVGAAT